jgi:hypothetical protein
LAAFSTFYHLSCARDIPETGNDAIVVRIAADPPPPTIEIIYIEKGYTVQ